VRPSGRHGAGIIPERKETFRDCGESGQSTVGEIVGHCPHCRKPLSAVRVEKIDVEGNERYKANGVSYSCPACETVLTVGIDPASVKADGVFEIEQSLGRIREALIGVFDELRKLGSS